jgi:hypothetical protein
MPRTVKRPRTTPIEFVVQLPQPSHPTRIQIIADYLKRHFPDFALQHSPHPSGALQVTLYRVSDGAYYRIKITAPFLASDSSPTEIETFLEQQGLLGHLPPPPAGPILVDTAGISFPNAAIQEKEEHTVWRWKLRQTLLLMRVQEATGL